MEGESKAVEEHPMERHVDRLVTILEHHATRETTIDHRVPSLFKCTVTEDGVRRRRSSTMYPTPDAQHSQHPLTEISDERPTTRPRRGSGPAGSSEHNLHDQDLARYLATPAVVAQPAPAPEHIASLVKQIHSDFQGGFIRYEQHGTGTRKGDALVFRVRNASNPVLKFLGAEEFYSKESWRATLVEGVTQTLFNFLHSLLVLQCLKLGQLDSSDPTAPRINPALSISAGTFFLIILLIYSAASSSGAHFNPLITFSTVLTGLTKPARGVMYLVAQFAGAILGSWFVHVVINDSEPLKLETELFGCSAPLGSESKHILGESIVGFFVLFVAYHVAFDPQNFAIFGAIGGPILIALAVSFAIFISGSSLPALGLNVMRCLGPAVIHGDTGKQWVYVVATCTSSVIHAMYYRLVPPHHVQVVEEAKKSSPAKKKKKLSTIKEDDESDNCLCVEEAPPGTAAASTETRPTAETAV